MAEALAALARHNLARLDHLLARRRHQSQLLTRLVADARAPGLTVRDEQPGEAWNWYTPLVQVHLEDPRGFCARLAAAGVANSSGSYGLIPADQRPVFAASTSGRCERAATYLDQTLAVVIADRDSDDRINDMATTIITEARQWRTP